MLYNILKHFHSGWAYLTVLMAVLFFVMVAYYAFGKKNRDARLTKLSFFTTLTFHIQLIVGVLLYFFSPFAQWTADTMKDSTNRLFAMEHPLMMFAAVILITVANSKLKKSEEVKTGSFVLVLIALLLTLSRIPWSQWLA